MAVRNLKEEDFVDKSQLANDTNQKSRIKDNFNHYGRKGLKPFGDLFTKYESELTPYFKLIGEGLRLGAQGLNGKQQLETSFSNESQSTQSSESNANQVNKSHDSRQMVASWFEQSADWFETTSTNLKSKNFDETIEYFENESRNHPTLFFSMSYMVGAVFGRIAKYAAPSASIKDLTSKLKDKTNTSHQFSTNR